MPRQIDEDRVFDAVLRLWIERGYAGTTTRAIADLAQVNESTLFRRYGGKVGLVLAALGAQLERVPLRQVAATDDLESDLVSVVEAWLETYRQVGAFFPLLLVEVGRHPELRPALDVAWTNLASVLAVIAHHQARGALRPEPPMTAASSLLGPLFVRGLFARAQPGLPLELDPVAHVRGYLLGRASRGGA